MRLYINIKPQRVVIPSPNFWGINMDRQLAGINAVAKVSDRTCYSVGGNGKTHWSAHTDITNQNIYVYNVEYHKRGKYKNNKEYLVYVYKFNVELLKVLGLSVEQKNYNFKFYKIDKYGKKIYL